MTWAMPALLVLSAPAVAASSFAPTEGVALRYTMTDERSEDATPIRSTSVRRIVFHRSPGGFRADLTIVSTDAAGQRGLATMSRRLMSALVGRTIRYDLDGQGNVVAVQDQAALMAVVVSVVGTSLPTDSPARKEMAAKLAASLAALPADLQLRLLASLIAPIVRPAEIAAQGVRDIALPLSLSSGPGATLPGRETVTRGAKGTIVIDTLAEGTVTAKPLASTPAVTPPPTTMRITQHRVIDPATGLVMRDERRTESWLNTAPVTRTVAVSTATLAVE